MVNYTYQFCFGFEIVLTVDVGAVLVKIIALTAMNRVVHSPNSNNVVSLI